MDKCIVNLSKHLIWEFISEFIENAGIEAWWVCCAETRELRCFDERRRSCAVTAYIQPPCRSADWVENTCLLCTESADACPISVLQLIATRPATLRRFTTIRSYQRTHPAAAAVAAAAQRRTRPEKLAYTVTHLPPQTKTVNVCRWTTPCNRCDMPSNTQ